MNYGELQDACLQHQLNDTKYRNAIKRFLNEAQNDIAKRVTMRGLFEAGEFTTSDRYFDLPADFLRLVEVSNSTNADNWNRLEPMTLRDFDEAPVAYGTPTTYTIAGGRSYLYPYPEGDTSIALTYQRLPVAMSADADEPEIPEASHDLLVSYALYRCYQIENDYEAAEYWKNDYETALARFMGQAQYDTFDGPRQVEGMMVYDNPIIDPSVWR